MRTLNKQLYYKQEAFTLVEVLVTVLVIAIGLLGLAGLQVQGLKNNLGAEQRAKASQLAYDMSDRIRANREHAKLLAGSKYNTLDPGSATEKVGCKATGTACSAADLAEHDLFEWNRDVSNAFPSGTADITINASGAVSLTISWHGNVDASDADASFALGFNLGII